MRCSLCGQRRVVAGGGSGGVWRGGRGVRAQVHAHSLSGRRKNFGWAVRGATTRLTRGAARCRIFYWHDASCRTQWEKPVMVESVDEPLPPGWEAKQVGARR